MTAATNPTELTSECGKKLVFVEDHHAQKCINCWFEWVEPGRCSETPCNSQQRTDGRVGHFEEGRA